jgi:molybdopterin-guanine dinucleotide biosynthesis protein A
MPRRIVLVLLTAAPWAPPGVDLVRWRAALAEDVVDLAASLAAADAGIVTVAADRALADAVAWPHMPVYEVDTGSVRAAFAAAARDGYEQAAVLPADVPDLPGLLVGKLLQPLGTRQAAVAPAANGGLVAVATRLPVPRWWPELDLDEARPDDVRAAAPRRAVVAETPGWHRLRGPDDLRRLDPGLEGWPTTRLLLGG